MAVDFCVIEGEAARPLPLAVDMVTGEIGHLRHARTKAGGADECAVGAGEAAAGHFLPARMLEILEEKIANSLGVQAPRLR